MIIPTMSVSSQTNAPARAFTLMELVVVMSIISIVTAIAAPRYFNSLQSYRVKSAAQRVHADLEYAQMKAKSTSSSRTVQFKPNTNRYSIAGEAGLKDSSTSYIVYLGEAPYHAGIHSIDLGGDKQITFDGYGNPDTNGVIILGAGSFRAAVMIDMETRKITIEPVDADLVILMLDKGLIAAID